MRWFAGADTWVEVAAFGQAKADWLRTFLALPHGIPAHDTFGRVVAALDPAQFERGFRSWVAAVADMSAGSVVAVDGTTLRRSHDRGQGKEALVLVRAWAEANRLALGQVAVAPGANELPAIPALLQLLALEGCLVTVDAIGCHAEIAAQITAQGADYVLALKANQPRLHDAVTILFREEQARGFSGTPHDYRRTIEKNHGRIEVRQGWTVDEPAVITYLDPQERWPRLRSIAMVVAERRLGAEISHETRYYLSSLADDAAAVGRPCAVIGASNIACTGCWTSPSGRMRAGCGKATPTRIWPCSSASPSTCCDTNRRRRWAPKPSASKLAGITPISCNSWRAEMRLPWLKAQCTMSAHGRQLKRSFEAYLEKVRSYHATEVYKKAIRKCQGWVEPLFAGAKEWHGLRRLRFCGLLNANIQGMLIAAGQNLKRFLAATGWVRRHAPCGRLLALPVEPERLSAAYG